MINKIGDVGTSHTFNPSLTNSQSNNPGKASNEAISTFNKATSSASGFDKGSSGTSQGDTMQDLLLALVQKLLEMLQGADGAESSTSNSGSDLGGGHQPRSGSTPDGTGGGIEPVTGSGPGGSSGSHIPAPTEHLQTINLGGKSVTVGGDGSASAAEVQSTAGSIQSLYNGSPTFKNMIDGSSDPAFEVSVGRRSDNTSWGNSDGRVFMNINNLSPGTNDTFQSMLGHEFAHASIDIGHGGQMEQIESRVAAEA